MVNWKSRQIPRSLENGYLISGVLNHIAMCCYFDNRESLYIFYLVSDNHYRHESRSFVAVCLVNKTTGDGAKNSM